MNIKRWFLGLAFTLTSILTLPAYAWPEVDHMNMCGSAVKPVHAGWKGWGQHDRYVAKRGNAYYLRTNCPTTVAPVKKYKPAKAAARKVTKARKAPKRSYRKVAKRVRAKAVKAKRVSSRASYNENYDCARVDLVNGYSVAQVKKLHGASVFSPAFRAKQRPAKRKYNYFKKR